jgi:capsular exopolysaccharide synthesis family protein
MTTMPTTFQERVPVPTALGPSGPAASGALTPGDVVAMLKRRVVTIIVLAILFASVGVGLFFLAWYKFPLYSAEAYIECVSPDPKPGPEVRDTKIAEDQFLRFVTGQALFIKSYSVLSLVLQDPMVQGTAWYQGVDQDERILEMEKKVSSSPVKDTNYIRVAVSTRSANDPHRIVNTVVSKYLAQIRDQSAAPFRDELNEYRHEQEQVRQQIAMKNEQIKNFIGTLDPGNIPEDRSKLGGGVTREQLLEHQKVVTQLEQQTSELSSLREQYSDPKKSGVQAEDKFVVEQDPRVAQLDNQVFMLEQEMNVLLHQFGPNHREFKDMLKRKVEAETQLQMARETRLRDVLNQKREQIDTAYYNSVHALNKARERLLETQGKQSDLERKQTEYVGLLEDRDVFMQIQNRLDEYIRDIDRVVRESSGVRVKSLASAQPPLQRSFPSLLLLPAIVLAAIGGAVGVGLGLELLDTSVKTSQDIVRHVNVPVLGSIPDIDDEEVEIARVETAVRDTPHAMITEAFRTVRSNLQFSGPAERLHAILITSPKPEDGRTTIAMNLASSLALAGRRVLLVDANFRRPSLHRFYNQVQGKGFSNVLVGDAAASDCIHHTDLPNLDVLGSGPIPPNPAELLGSDLCRQFVGAMSQSYDHVLFDSPPVLLASDAAVLASLMDGTILVLRAKENTRGVAQRACSLLFHVNARVLGAVLNAAQARRGGYFREQLRTFYEYQNEDADGRRALPDDTKGKRKGKQDDDDLDDA